MSKREEVTIEVSKQFVDSFKLHDSDRAMLFNNELKHHSGTIENLLLGYHYAEAGRVSDVGVRQDSITFNKGINGSFIAEYKTYFAMACSDKGYSNHNKMIIDFEIDLPNKRIQLLGEEIWERLSDDF